MKDFLDKMLSAFGMMIFIPIFVVLIVLMFIYQMFFGAGQRIEHKNDTDIIYTSKLKSTVWEIANECYAKEEFEKIELDEKEIDPKIKYTFKDRDKTPNEYEILAKNEVKKMYEKLKPYTLIKDQPFAELSQTDIGFTFYLTPVRTQDFTYLCGLEIRYNDEGTLTEEWYNHWINDVHITDDDLTQAIRGW